MPGGAVSTASTQKITPPVRRLQMHNHPRPHGFGGLAPNGKTDATSHATRDNRPELIAIEPESVDVGTATGADAGALALVKLRLRVSQLKHQRNRHHRRETAATSVVLAA